LKVCDERNEAEEVEGGTAVHGITQFADLSAKEFEDGYLGGGGYEGVIDDSLGPYSRELKDEYLRPNVTPIRYHVEEFHPNASNATFHHHYGVLHPTWWHHDSVKGLTYNHTYANWARTYTTTVNNQGYCGACWAFSVVQQVESDAIRAGLITAEEKLSYSQVASCDPTNNRCGVSLPQTHPYHTDHTVHLHSHAVYIYHTESSPRI
jgi:hypothetical protein